MAVLVVWPRRSDSLVAREERHFVALNLLQLLGCSARIREAGRWSGCNPFHRLPVCLSVEEDGIQCLDNSLPTMDHCQDCLSGRRRTQRCCAVS